MWNIFEFTVHNGVRRGRIEYTGHSGRREKTLRQSFGPIIRGIGPRRGGWQ